MVNASSALGGLLKNFRSVNNYACGEFVHVIWLLTSKVIGTSFHKQEPAKTWFADVTQDAGRETSRQILAFDM